MKLKLASFALFFSILFLLSPVYADWSPPQFAPPNEAGLNVPLNASDAPQDKIGDLTASNFIGWSSVSAVGPLSVFSSSGGKNITKRFQVSAPDGDVGFLALFSANNAEVFHLGDDGPSWFTGGLFGLGTANPTATLDVNGSFHYFDPKGLPQAGQVLTSDDSGNASWETPSGGVGGLNGDRQPTCDSSYRGRFWFTPAAARAKDSLEVCAKDSSDRYDWQRLY